ncbi:hypothetical protein PP641_gp080 [Arthrobacter phage SilentRX]|uniref:Uncharacterized protein n=1 Tax=Arthrobacter phage SilentRX TaxID=2836091 RepID=A0A8F3INM1_9CAUD|nr:hypothetical protein PP641_gp080 [Arthrobacter phage SilentRX]QWY82820.1 hypothetical protein SEA_SILENTRX_80 [Arthrobacter phage SilentRX]
MSHSTVLVVLKDADVEANGLDDALAAALEKFDENKNTPQYIRKTRQQLIDDERKSLEWKRENFLAKYQADPAGYAATSNATHVDYVRDELPALLEKLDDDDAVYASATRWDKDSLDADGNLLSTYNPHSKWDWYTVGGRWSNSVLNTTRTVHHPAEKRSETWTTKAWDEETGGVDYLQKKDLEVCHGTFAFLGTDGEWHERGRMGWFGMVSDEQEPDVWDTQLKELIEKVDANDWLVVVDVHI